MIECHVYAPTGSLTSFIDFAVTFPAGKFGEISALNNALQACSAVKARKFTTSVFSIESGAFADANSHFNARGKQAAIFTGPAAVSRASAGSFRADNSHKSATASNGCPDSHNFRKTACLTS